MNLQVTRYKPLDTGLTEMSTLENNRVVMGHGGKLCRCYKQTLCYVRVLSCLTNLKQHNPNYVSEFSSLQISRMRQVLWKHHFY